MADLRREYGIDLLDLWRGQLSFFELTVYLAGLPESSRTARLMRDLPEETEGWGLTEILIAGLIDTVRGLVADKDQQIESVIPKALLNQPQQASAELKPMSELSNLFGVSSEQFATQHGR